MRKNKELTEALQETIRQTQRLLTIAKSEGAGAAQGGNRVHRQPTPVVDNSRERREARRTAARKAKEARLSRIKQLAELIVGNQRTRFFDRWKRNVRRKKVPPCPNIGTPNSPIRAREVDVRELKSSASPNTHTLPCPACPHATRADLLL